MSKDDELTDEQLLNMPENAIPEADVARLLTLLEDQLHSRQIKERSAELNGYSLLHTMLRPDEDPKARERERQEKEFEQRMRVLGERQDRLLARIEEREHEIEKRRKEIEDNALRLRDGRRVYVDGERYRDEQGHVLTGADEAEAARAHELNPNASTWQQKEEVERQAEEARKLKEKILHDREQGIPPEEAERRMDGYEKEFDQQVQARATEPGPDYGTADVDAFADEYQISSKPAFTAAASVTRETNQPAEKETESATADAKIAPRPFGQGALKL
jgi:hypothetical protein